MGCLVIMAMFMPRIVTIFIWILTNWWSQAFVGWFWPFLGFLFMPYTTLAVMAARLNNGQVSGWWVLLVIIAVLCDLGSDGSTTKSSITSK